MNNLSSNYLDQIRYENSSFPTQVTHFLVEGSKGLFLLKLDLVISGDSESDRYIMEEKVQKQIWFNDKGMSDKYPHEVRINPYHSG